MPRCRIALMLVSAFFLISAHVSAATAPIAPSVLTQHNNNARTGVNPLETILTPATVAVATFGKLFTLTLSSNVNGQVLYVPALKIGGKIHNVVFAYCSNNGNNSPCGLFAFDAESEGPALWNCSLPNGAQYTTGTPAIDPASKTMYLVSKDLNDDGSNWLHAVDILDGSERPGSPVKITGVAQGMGAGNQGGKLGFPATHANSRPGVLIEKGLIYIAFAFNSDAHPYHGWVFCYGYDGSSFTQKGVLCTTPDPDVGKPQNYSKDGGGIWQSGKGLASDGKAIYCTTGNGSFTADTGGRNFSMCFLKLHPVDLQVMDYFAEAKLRSDSDADLDLGNCGPLIIPGTTVLFAGATKYGRSHLVDTMAMGHFNADKDACLQTLSTPAPGGPVGENAVAWNVGPIGSFIYLWNPTQQVAQYVFEAAKRAVVAPMPGKSGLSSSGGGGGLCVTSNGMSNGILWCVGMDGVVHALDAMDVSKELWNSSQNPDRDGLGSVGHFQFPTVVSGKAYIPTGDGKIVVYGLLKR